MIPRNARCNNKVYTRYYSLFHVGVCCKLSDSHMFHKRHKTVKTTVNHIGTARRISETSETYLLTPWCRVLLEKLTGLQLVKKLPAFHGTRRFITALTSFRHLSLSWASPIQSIYPHATSWRSTLILSTHLCLDLPSGILPSGFPTKILYTPSPHLHVPHAQPISFFSILSPAQYWVRSTNHLATLYAISSIPPLPPPSYVQIFSSTP